MDNQTESFNPYQQWLEIPAEDQPPNHYRLLGVDDFESDTAVIDEAAKARAAYLHRIAAGPERKAVQQLLNEVAAARRTLLNVEAKAAYDQRLQADDEPDEASFAPAIQIAATDSGVRRAAQSSSEGKAAVPRRRKKSAMNDWKLHAISASVLLVITLIVLVVNSGNGQRLASQPAGPAYQPSAKSTSAARSGQQRNRSLSVDLNRNNSTGSGSLASDFSAAGRAAPAVAKKTAPATAKPKKQPAPKSSVTLTLNDKWLDGLTVVEDFSKSLEGRFKRTEADERITLDKERLVVKQAAADNKHLGLPSTKIVVIPGDAVALETNLTKGLPDQMRVGIGLGTLRFYVQSKPKNLEVIAFRTKLATLNPVADQTLTLMLIRDVQQPNAVNWIVRSGDKNVSGRVRLEGLPIEAPVTVLVSCPQSATSEPVWIDNLRHGSQSQPLDLKNPKERKVEVPPKK